MKKKDKIENQSAITLISLVVTIIILIILAAVSINLVFGQEGIITRAQLARFATEMQQIKERVMLKQNDNAMQKAMGNNQPLFEEKLTNLEGLPNTLKQEVLYIRAGYPSDKKVTDFNTEDFDQIIENNESSSESESIYIIDKETANGKENTYILDMKSYVVFKIKQTKIGGQVYHSYDMASLGKSGGKEEQEEKIDLIEKEESEVTNVDGVYCYSPNMKGFNKNDTYIELYNETTNTFDEQIKLKDANLKTINSNKKWYNYGNQIWANVKTNSNGLEAWWVWIPRYAYKMNDTSTEPPIDVIYVGTDNKPLDPKYNGVLPENYIVHSGFTTDKELYGIWMSKYEPSNNFDYISTTSKCYAPDMSGFDKNSTYIELYDASTNSFGEEIKLADANLSTINNNNTWYDYSNQIWANIKTNSNGLEAWWVWIPRYAYKITENVTEANIIFIDLNNKPIDKEQFGDSLPEGYVVHKAFTPSGTDGNKNLKGIWMSKYEPSNNFDYTSTTTLCYAPDTTGFDNENTYIELYDASTNTFSEEVKLKDANLDTINNNKTWYDYQNKVWANVKTNANGLEAWWVWIPRYAYKITENITEANIIFVDLDDKPIDKAQFGDSLPEGYIVHPAFKPSGTDGSKNLKGIWMSKYEPSWVGN